MCTRTAPPLPPPARTTQSQRRRPHRRRLASRLRPAVPQAPSPQSFPPGPQGARRTRHRVTGTSAGSRTRRPCCLKGGGTGIWLQLFGRLGGQGGVQVGELVVLVLVVLVAELRVDPAVLAVVVVLVV